MSVNHLSVSHALLRKCLYTTVAALALALVAALTPFDAAHAQAPGGMRIPPHSLEQLRPDGSAVRAAEATSIDLVVDTDTGVDDAAALVWLLQLMQNSTALDINLLGITTVAGNTTVENATSNVLKILDVMHVQGVPVYMGLAKPLSRQLSQIGLPLHGPDGLGYQNMGSVSSTELAGAKREGYKFMCDTAQAHPGATLVELGPPSNVARAVQQCPEKMRNYTQIVILGGAKYAGGNTTAVAEFNFWQDPEAADLVLSAGLNLVLVPFDAFGQFRLSWNQAQALSELDPNPGSALVGNALKYYLSVQLPSMFSDPDSEEALDFPLPVPDPAAMMAALQPGWVTGYAPGLVHVIAKPDLVRGQSVIGLWPQEQFMMIASDKEIDQVSVLYASGEITAANELYGSILQREPPNVESVVMSFVPPDADPPDLAASMVGCFLFDMGLANYPCTPPLIDQNPDPDSVVTGAPTGELDGGMRLFLPALLKP